MYICITYITLLSKNEYRFWVLSTTQSRAKIRPVKLILNPQWLWLLLVRRRFCCCLIFVTLSLWCLFHRGWETWPWAYKTFSCSTQLSRKFQLFIKTKILTNKQVVFIMLINVKIPTIVCISTFMSMINFVLNWVKHKKYIT